MANIETMIVIFVTTLMPDWKQRKEILDEDGSEGVVIRYEKLKLSMLKVMA